MSAPFTKAPATPPVFRHFRATPVTPKIGATIEGLHLAELNDESAAELRQALWHYGVLFAPAQHLTPAQQKKVALVFGEELETHSFGKNLADQGHPEVLLIEMYQSDKAKTTTDIWHHDVTGRRHPNIASVLQADEVPFGADTMWASAAAAWDSLPYALKLMFLHLDLDHDTIFGLLRHDFGDAGTTRAIEQLLKMDEANTWPAVINHPVTGRLSLFVGNAWIKRVHGYPAELSELILKIASDLTKIPEFQVRHQWRKGDVAIWDNFATWHYGVTADLGTQVRRLHRVSAWSKQVSPALDREKAIRELKQARV